MKKEYDVIIVGAGHAGCEAAYAASKKNKKTLLITINKKNIADMACNPSIGGTAKGIIVREIDALGGIMGKVADRSHFQIKMLNNTKGPAVRSLRAQVDKIVYPINMLKSLESNSNLEILEGIVKNLIIEDNKVIGIELESGRRVTTKAVILTTGTYLNSYVLRGSSKEKSGPHGEKTSIFLSDNLKSLGFEIQRLKTGTPPRIKKDSIDFSKMTVEEGDNECYTFSYDNECFYDAKNQEKCYLLYTTDLTHKTINENLKKSSMYGGYVEGIGPRYCPSIEDKIVKFADKARHQLFLEPESKSYDEWYLQGFSTSMPTDVQDKMVHSLPGLGKAIITKYAYAIEYDAINPLQLKPSLETKLIENLYTAGQINGTSGYEEAAGQGLIAGINASLKLEGQKPLILKRNEAYIGVLIDDLVTKGTNEPYRMLTSRAEYRLILRHDNADIRLRKIAYDVGMINAEEYKKFDKKLQEIEKIILNLKNSYLKNHSNALDIFKKYNLELPKIPITLFNLLKRPEINIKLISEITKLSDNKEVLEEVEIITKYEGYIKKTYKDVEKMVKLEKKTIPENINYKKITNLATEARQKLEKIRPLSIGQASRVSGVNPSDIAILCVYLKKEYPNE